jgi:hypothetical protein
LPAALVNQPATLWAPEEGHDTAQEGRGCHQIASRQSARPGSAQRRCDHAYP